MRTILKYGEQTIIGENINNYATKVSIKERPDLGSILLFKTVEEFEENTLLDAGLQLINREVEMDFGTFIVNGDKVMLKGREDIGYVEMEGGYDKSHLFTMYQNIWEPILKKEERKAAREQKKEAKQDFALFS